MPFVFYKEWRKIMLKFCRECKRVIASVLLCLTLVGSFVSNPIVALADKKEEATTKDSGGKDDTAENRIQQNYKLNAGDSMSKASMDSLEARDIEYLGTFLSNFYVPFDTEISDVNESGISKEDKANRQATRDFLVDALTKQMNFEEATAKEVVNGVIGASISSATELKIKCTYDDKTTEECIATFYDFLTLVAGGTYYATGVETRYASDTAGKQHLSKAELIFKKDNKTHKAFAVNFRVQDNGVYPVMTASLTSFLSYYCNLDVKKGIGSCAMDADKSMYDLTTDDGAKKLLDDLGENVKKASVLNWRMYVDCFGNILVNCGNGRRFVVLPACANPFRFQLREDAEINNNKVATSLWDAIQDDEVSATMKDNAKKIGGNTETAYNVLKKASSKNQPQFERCYKFIKNSGLTATGVATWRGDDEKYKVDIGDDVEDTINEDKWIPSTNSSGVYGDRDVSYAIALLLENNVMEVNSSSDTFNSSPVMNYTTLYNINGGGNFSASVSDDKGYKAVISTKNLRKDRNNFTLQRGVDKVDFDTKWYPSEGNGGKIYKEALTREKDAKNYVFKVDEDAYTDGIHYPSFKFYFKENKGGTLLDTGDMGVDQKFANKLPDWIGGDDVDSGDYTDYISNYYIDQFVVLDTSGSFKNFKADEEYSTVNVVKTSSIAKEAKKLKSSNSGFSTTAKAENKIKNSVKDGQAFLTGISLSYLFAFYYTDGGSEKVSYKAREGYFPTVSVSDYTSSAAGSGASSDTLQTEVLSLAYYFLHPTVGKNIVATWFKNKVSGTLLKWHSDMTGASDAKSTTGTTKYVSFTGYVTMPALKDVSWLDTIMNYYKSLSVFFIIFMFIMVVLYIMAGSMTLQRGIVAIIIFAFCVTLPPQAIDATVAVSNKFSETAYNEKFTYWALLQNESYLDDLNAAENAETYSDYLIGQWKTQIANSNVAENLVDVKWMTPKKNNYAANVEKEVKNTIQDLPIWKFMNGTVSAQISGEDYQRTANQLTLYRSYTDINSYSRYIYSNIETKAGEGKVTNGDYMNKIDQGDHPTLKSARTYMDSENEIGLIDAIKLGFNVDSGEHSGAKTGTKRFYGMTCSSAIAEQMNKVGKVKDTLTKVKENNFIGVNTDLYNWDLSNFNRQKGFDDKALSPDTADIACFALMTESPYYYFSWNFFDQGSGDGSNGYTLKGTGLKADGTATGGYKNMVLGTQDYFYNNQLKSNIRGYGEVRDFLDMRSLFTVVIPYLKEANELYMEYGKQFGFNLYDEVEYRYDAEKWKEYDAIKDESERSQTLKKYWHNCNISQLLDMYTPWVDVMYECDYALAETIEVAGKKYSVSDPLNPDTYPYKEGRPMIFSRSEMIYYGLNENNLTAVERKIINVTDKSLDDMFDLVNYYNFSDVVLNNAASMLTTFNFNKEFSQTSFASGTHELYPQSFELKNFNYDAFMRLILSNNTGESMTDNSSMAQIGDYTATESNKVAGTSNIYESITEKSSILTPLMLIVLDFMSIYIIPFLRFAFIILIFFMSIIMILGGMIRAEENMLKVAWKNLIQPLLNFLLISCGMAFIVSLFMSNGYTGITGDTSFSISLGDPVMTIIALIVIDGVVIWLYFKLTKKMISGVIKWGKVVLSSMQGAVGGALSNAVSGFTASRRAKSFGKAIGEGMRGGGSGSGGYGSGGSGGADAGDVNDRGNRNTKVGAGAVNFANMSTTEAPDGMSASEIEKDIADGKAKMENDTPQTKGFFGRRMENAKNRYDNFTDSVDRKVNNVRRKVNNAKDYASATGREVAYGAKMVGKGAKAFGSGAVAVGSAVGSKTKKAGLKASALGRKGANKVNSMKKSVVSNGFTKVNAFNRKRMNKRLEMYKHRDSLNPNAGFKSEATKALEAKIARAKARQANYAKGEIGITKGVQSGAGKIKNFTKTKASHVSAKAHSIKANVDGKVQGVKDSVGAKYNGVKSTVGGKLNEVKGIAGVYASETKQSIINKLGGKDKLDNIVGSSEYEMNALLNAYGSTRFKTNSKGKIRRKNTGTKLINDLSARERYMPTLDEFDSNTAKYSRTGLTREKLVAYYDLQDKLQDAKRKQALLGNNSFKDLANIKKESAKKFMGKAKEGYNTFRTDVRNEFSGMGDAFGDIATDMKDSVYDYYVNDRYERENAKLQAKAEKKAQKEERKKKGRE